MSQLFAKLPELCCVNFLDNDVEIISVKKQSIYVRDVNNLDEAIKSITTIQLLFVFKLLNNLIYYLFKM